MAKVSATSKGPASARPRRNRPPEEGHLSSTMCHMANTSYRLGRSIEFDPETERCIGDEEAEAMLRREYRPPFEVPEEV